MLPEDAFQQCGNRKIQLHGGGNPFSFIGDAISSIGNAFEDVIGTVGDGLAGLDDWVREEIPGGWLLPVAAVAAVATGGGSLAALGEAAAVEGGAAAAGGVGGVAGATASSIAAGTLTAVEAAELAGLGASSVTSSVGAANLAAGAASGAYGSTVASLVAAGMPASMAMALPSVSTLASNAAVNAAMQMATTGKVDVGSLVKSLAMGSVSSVAGAGVSSAVGSLGIDNPLLASIANSAAQGATGAVLSGRNPVTAALASALAGGVGFATQGSGLPQTAVNTTINALASGQSVQNALISAAIATGSSAAKEQIKGFFQDIGAAQGKTKEEVGTAFENMCTAKSEENKFITGKQEEFTQDQATIDGNKDKIDAFQELRGTYDSKIESYERNKELATNTAAYEAEMRSQGYEQFKNGDGDPLFGPNGWAQRTGGHWVTRSNDDGAYQSYEPDSGDEDSNSIKYIPAPNQSSYIAAANADVREANSIGEQLNIAYTGKAEDIAPLQNAVTEKEQAYQNKLAAAESLDSILDKQGYVLEDHGEDGGGLAYWSKSNWSLPVPQDVYNAAKLKEDTTTAEANAAKADLDAAKTKLTTATKTNDIVGKYGVADVFAANKRITDNLALYKDISTATTTALTTLNGFVPPEKLSETLTTELTAQTKDAADAEQAKADKLAKDTKDAKDKADAQAAADAAQKIADDAKKLADEQAAAQVEADRIAAAEAKRIADDAEWTKQEEIRIKADAEAERVRLQAEADAKNKETTEVIPEVTPEVKPEVNPKPTIDWSKGKDFWDGNKGMGLYQQPNGDWMDASGNVVDVSTFSDTAPAWMKNPVSFFQGDVGIVVFRQDDGSYLDGNGNPVDVSQYDEKPIGPPVNPVLPPPDKPTLPEVVVTPEEEDPTPPPETDFEPYEPLPVEPKPPGPDQPEGCQLPFVDDGTGRCILPEDKEKEDNPIPDCGPGMVWSLTDNACVPVTDITPPVVTPITPKPPVTPPVVPVKPVVPTTPNTAVNPAQTQQNQQNALLMGLLLGQQQQAPQQQQPASLVKIDKPFDWSQDILGAADYEKATQRPYAAGGSVHSINDELIKLLRS